MVSIGDYFVSSWGYEQTNIDFYKVVGITKSGKSVKIKRVHNAYVDSIGQEDIVVPSDNEYGDEVMTKRLHLGGYKDASISINSYANAYLWDGTAARKTNSMFGH